MMGQFIARTGVKPDLAITSPAVRAADTLRLGMEAGGWTCVVSEREQLYGRGVTEFLGEIRQTPASVRILLAVGHEPTWSESVTTLTDAAVRMPTATMACIDIGDRDWSEVEPGSGVLSWLVTPRLVGSL
jgi:phosphohistidine phosphatase